MSWRLTFLAAVAIVAVAGIAIAAQGGSKNVVLCAAKKGGSLRLASKGKCAKGERKLTIAKKGPRGAVGAPGAQGPPGTTASIQPEAVRLVGPVSDDCTSTPGTFCGSEGLDWGNRGSVYASVGFWKDATGEVHLQGTAQGSPGALGNDIFVLPAGYRPVGMRQFMITNCAGDPVELQLEASGYVHVPGLPPDHCASLDGISFRP